jgi:hypothetical protein
MRGINEAARRTDSEELCANAKKRHSGGEDHSGCRCFGPFRPENKDHAIHAPLVRPEAVAKVRLTELSSGMARINRSTNTAWQRAAPFTGTGGLRVDGGYVQLSGANAYSGLTQVSGSEALLAVNGSVTGKVQVDANAAFGGSSVIAGNIGGSGIIGPVNSPGLLTVHSQVEPTATTSFAFEFMHKGHPIWSIGAASKNDVLQLTNVAPFANSLTATNIVNIYFKVASLAKHDTIRGGFFSNHTSRTLDFVSAIGAPTYQYHVLGSGSGTHDYNGAKYYTCSEFLAAHPSSGITGGTASVVNVPTADFSSGTVTNGQVPQFVIIAEPDTILFAGIGIAATNLGLARRRP